MKLSGLAVAVVLTSFSGNNNSVVAIPNHIPTTPQGHGSNFIGAAKAEAFVNQQFADYFVDCVAFVDSFHTQFQYCDGSPCVKKEADLLAICLATEGAPNEILSLRILPSTETPFDPSYATLTAVGLQTVYLALDPTNPTSLTPLCFDFAIREDLINTLDGLKSTLWDGYYKVSFGVCVA